MKRLAFAILSVMLLFSCCACAEELNPGMLLDDISAQWGEPVARYGSTARIWEKDGQILIASFRYSMTQNAGFLRDYVLLGEDRTYLAGTIPAEDTLFRVYDKIASTSVADMPQVFGVGSSYYAIMTADGYIVSWLDDYPNIFFDMHMRFYDCVAQEDFGGRMWEYLLYTILPK